MWGKGEMHRGLTGNPALRRPLCRTENRWEDNIKMDLKDAIWEQGLD